VAYDEESVSSNEESVRKIGGERETLPCIERLKEPSLSEASESAPHCKMTAPGLYQSIIACMTCTYSLPNSARMSQDVPADEAKMKNVRV